jgi:hypothetical protein
VPFSLEQSQLQRDWQERMWNMNNAYNSPDAMIARGLNPFIQGSAAMAGSKAPASGGAAATAAPVPSMQAFRPNFSNVFNSLVSTEAKERIIGIIHIPHSFLPITLELRLLGIKRILLTHHAEVNLILMILVNHA